MVASHVPPTGDLAHNPGMCPDWELNQQPFCSQARTQPTESYQPGQKRKNTGIILIHSHKMAIVMLAVVIVLILQSKGNEVSAPDYIVRYHMF